jgi:hypothetical protein
MTSRLPRCLLQAGLLCAPAFGIAAHAVTIDELASKIATLEAQNAALQAKVERLESAQLSPGTAPTPQAVERVQPTDTAASANSRADWAAATTVSSYGEIGYTRPSKSPQQTNVSVGRAVIGMTHRFDDATTMVGEWEWENAIVSSSDAGESEIEQLYVEHEFRNDLRAVAGLYLMPVGLINETHEPTAYYGVFRPDVDTKIIPSTWREVGLGLAGHTDVGLSWNAGLTTAPNLSKWDPTSAEGRVRGPLQTIHAEGQFALARDLGAHAALNWRTAGFLLGASVFSASLGQQQPGFLGNDARVLLWDVHTRYEALGWDLAAEFARGTISHTEALNAHFAAATPNPTLVPSLFYGGYVQAAYKAGPGRYFRLTPFARYERLNTAAEYRSQLVPAGTGVQPDEIVWTLGASFFVGDGVVLKTDYRHYRNDQRPSAIPPGFAKGNSLNLGIGYSF